MPALKAFTLIELLVAIAIIAILAALLLPTLSGAKNRAAKTTDLNNLRQITLAVALYADSDNEVLPWPNWDYGGKMHDGTVRPGWLYTPDLAAKGPDVFKAETGLLWESLPNPKVFLCPMDRPELPRYHTNSGKMETRPQQLSSYIMNGAVIGFRSGFQSNAVPVKLSQMRPGDCIYFEADDSNPFGYNDGSSWPNEGITSRHSQGATQAALDGSAGYVRNIDWLNDVKFTNKNRLWCYPNTVDGGDSVFGHDR